MLQKRYHRLVHYIALFAIIFASLAPTISHAIAAQTGISSFSQLLCKGNGDVVVIQVITTKGNQLATELPVTQTEPEAAPKNMGLHLEHCPFCSIGVANLAIAPTDSAWIFLQAEQAKAIHETYTAPFQTTYLQTAHLSRAPPAL